jgi:subtilisin family serine protease
MAVANRRPTGLTARIGDEVQQITETFLAPNPIETHDIGAGRSPAEPIGRKVIKVKPADTGGIDYIYADGQILVRDMDADAVVNLLSDGGKPRPVARRVIRGVQLLHLAPAHGDVEEALDRIDRELGGGVATPDHVLTVSQTASGQGEVGGCPATEPQEVYYGTEPFPSVCHENSGTGVLIYIGDTGLLPDAPQSHSWLDHVSGRKDPNTPAGNDASIQPYAGHGTFVAGVARCIAPAADVFVDNVFAVAGSNLESDMVKRLEQALRRGSDIIHLSVSAPSRKDLPLIAFTEWLRRLRHHKGVVCVAPTGNNATRRPHWPAAFPEVVSVGALGADWRGRAEFSNYGGWVNVYAPGRNLVNAYTTGTYTCQITPYTGATRKFYGMAQWSGTSFSTPIVTGLIAARMSRTGESGREAAAALLQQARSQAIPGVGAILLPERGQDAAGMAGPAQYGRTYQPRSGSCWL